MAGRMLGLRERGRARVVREDAVPVALTCTVTGTRERRRTAAWAVG